MPSPVGISQAHSPWGSYPFTPLVYKPTITSCCFLLSSCSLDSVGKRPQSPNPSHIPYKRVAGWQGPVSPAQIYFSPARQVDRDLALLPVKVCRPPIHRARTSGQINCFVKVCLHRQVTGHGSIDEGLFISGHRESSTKLLLFIQGLDYVRAGLPVIL